MNETTVNHAEQEEVETVLSSGSFSKAPAQAKLLKYICSEYFSGRADRIKEYALATDVFGRTSDFDQNQDAIVRVEAHRLRKKLKEYYEGEGANHAIQIVLEPGRYIPRFVPREQQEPAGQEKESQTHALEGNASITELHLAKALPQRAGGDERRRPLSFLLSVAALTILAVGGFLLWRKRTRAATESTAATTPLGPPPANLGPDDTVRILAGNSQGRFIDRSGAEWGPDRFVTGGEVASQPRQFIARTLDNGIYEHWRQGEFSYDIPLKPGVYELHLYFNEEEFGPDKIHGGGEASRIFNIDSNGKPLLFQFDILRDTGSNETADERIFTDISPASDGFLHLKFIKQTDYPLLNAIEIVPGTTGKMLPLRIVASDIGYTDHNGNIWLPDRYFMGGRLSTHNLPIKGTADVDLYSSHRFGYFNYLIPVATGSKYSATLYFSETYFGAENPGATGIGSRLFDVFCNGAALLRNFDVLKEAGGANRALTETFHNLVPNASGKLVFTFVPSQNYACINAIEVHPE